MAAIHKFSLVYDGGEDRLAWDCEDLDGAATRLWLTARLCRGLVKAIVPMLRQRSDLPPEHEATMQSWAQAEAMTDFGQTPPVRPGERAVFGLVSAAHIRPSGDGLILTFDFGAGDCRTIAVTLPAVRQLLAIMHRLHLAAGWPVDVWPSWISEPAAAASGDVVN